MRNSNKTRALAACVGALALAGVGASSAAAVPATFSNPGQVTITNPSPIVIKAGTTPSAATTYTCSAAQLAWNTASAVQNSGNPLQGSLYAQFQGQCVNGLGHPVTTLFRIGHLGPQFLANKTGSTYTLNSSWSANVDLYSPLGLVTSGSGQAVPAYSAAWTNGTSAVNPSSLTFSEAAVGKVSNADSGIQGQPVKITGTLKLTRGGSLLTLN